MLRVAGPWNGFRLPPRTGVGAAILLGVAVGWGLRSAALTAGWTGQLPDLENRVLMRATLRDANLGGLNLRGAVLERADLARANLGSSRLDRANLRSANLVRSNLGGASLVGADLRRARLEQANLDGASLRHACLRDACLDGASLIDVDLRDADLRGASYNAETQWPAGTDPVAMGAVAGAQNTAMVEGHRRVN